LAKAKTSRQKEQLHRIGKRLGLYKKKVPETSTKKSTLTPTEDTVAPAQKGAAAHTDKKQDLYRYYMHDASLFELENYLSTSNAKNTLTYRQYNALKGRYRTLKEERLLKEGTLEELIDAYKKNNDPKYKAKILARMKALQAQE
jgi:hypothetical protein